MQTKLRKTGETVLWANWANWSAAIAPSQYPKRTTGWSISASYTAL